jgi:hypothetical protein
MVEKESNCISEPRSINLGNGEGLINGEERKKERSRANSLEISSTPTVVNDFYYQF